MLKAKLKLTAQLILKTGLANMDLFEKLIIGIAVTIIGALVLYSFRVRQLYLLVPKMFGYSALTEKGKILELRAFNRGRSMEEDVHIDMSPALTYELIASDHPDVVLVKNKLQFARVAPRSEISIVLMAEGNIEAENFAPTISSKATKGSVVKKQDEVPPNAGNVVLGIGAVLLFCSAAFILPSKWLDYQKQQELEEKKVEIDRFKFLEKEGWRGIDSYVFSQARRSYSEFEFPLLFTGARQVKNELEITLSAINKTATPLRVDAYFFSTKLDAIIGDKTAFSVNVPPMQSVPIVVSSYYPENHDLDQVFVRVNFSFGGESLYGISFLPQHNKKANSILEALKKKK